MVGEHVDVYALVGNMSMPWSEYLRIRKKVSRKNVDRTKDVVPYLGLNQGPSNPDTDDRHTNVPPCFLSRIIRLKKI